MSAFNAWENFYVITGSSAGALIGLQFVVLTLLANRPARQNDPGAGQAFATPNIVHFCNVLGLAALLTAPWHSVLPPAILCGAVGIGGIVYVLIVVRRMRIQKAYKPVFEDWLCHVILPMFSYLTLASAAVAARSYLQEALFAIGGVVVLLLLIGIHNAWDAVTFHVFSRKDVSPTDQAHS